MPERHPNQSTSPATRASRASSASFVSILNSIVLLFAMLQVPGCASPDTASKAALGILPTGQVQVDIMGAPQRPPSDLQVRIQKAIASDPDWFGAYSRDQPPGQELPYHPKFGVTEEEFDQWKREAADIHIEKLGTAVLTVRQSGDSTFVLEADGPLADLDGIAIDLASDVIRTPLGDADVRSEINSSERQIATGPWNGYKWTNDEEVPDVPLSQLDFVMVQFSLGRLEDSGRGILHYDAMKTQQGTVVARSFWILYFD